MWKLNNFPFPKKLFEDIVDSIHNEISMLIFQSYWLFEAPYEY